MPNKRGRRLPGRGLRRRRQNSTRIGSTTRRPISRGGFRWSTNRCLASDYSLSQELLYLWAAPWLLACASMIAGVRNKGGGDSGRPLCVRGRSGARAAPGRAPRVSPGAGSLLCVRSEALSASRASPTARRDRPSAPLCGPAGGLWLYDRRLHRRVSEKGSAHRG